MAFQFNKSLLKQLQQEKKAGKGKGDPGGKKPSDVPKTESPTPMPAADRVGIRFCRDVECLAWQANNQLIQLGAGYGITGEGVHLRDRLIRTVRMSRDMLAHNPGAGPNRVLVLKGTPQALGTRYFELEPVCTLQVIGAVCNGVSRMVAWMDYTTMTDADTADLILAVIANPAIMDA